jgi:competence protein ComEC
MMDKIINKEIPLFRLLIPFAAGIWLGVSHSWYNNIWGLYVASGLLLLVFILLNNYYKKFQLYKKQWLGGLLIGILLFLFGIIQAENCKEINHQDHFSLYPSDQLIICVNQEPKISGDILRFTAAVKANIVSKQVIQSSGSLLIALKIDTNQITQPTYGDLLLIKSKYTPTEPPYNPAEFNYKKYLQNQNIYYQTFINQSQHIKLKSKQGDPVIDIALKVRRNMVAKLNHYMTDKDAITVASTLILGYRAELSKDILQAYSKTGTTHVLSVSGMHVALIYIFIDTVLKFLNRYKNGIILKAILSITLIWLYALLTGFSPAVCRAAVMISFVIFGKAFKKNANMLNILAISAFILLLYNPLYIADVGFQLSYLAIFGLIALQPLIENLISIRNPYLVKPWSICAASLAAQIITFPLCILYFHQFPIYFLISNIFIAIPATVIMYSGVTMLLIPEVNFLTWLIKITAGILEFSLIIMNETLKIIENLPYASWNKIWINPLENFLLYFIIIILVSIITAQKKPVLIKLLSVAFFILVTSFSLKTHQSFTDHSTTFLSLRKNAALAFKNKTKMILLTDLKSHEQTFRFSIQPFIDSSKTSELTLLNFDQDLKLPQFQKRGNLIQFGKQTLLLFDKNLTNKKLTEPLKINYLYVSGNPKISVNILLKNYTFDYLIIDGRNSDFLIKKLKEEAEIAGIKTKVLKRSKHLTL